MPAVSVIVPCYRAGRFLPRFCASLKAQTYAGEWEAVFVDDGDPEAATAYEALDDSRFRLVHRSNGGLSAARNTGLLASTGEIVLFADPDDVLGPEWMEHLVDAAGGVDFAWGGCIVHGEGGASVQIPPDAGAVYEGGDVRRRVWRAAFGYTLLDVLRWWTPRRMWKGCRREFGSVCWRAFRRSVIGELRFDEKLLVYEDAMFLCAYALRARSLRINGNADYEYFIRADGKMCFQNATRRVENKFDLRDARRMLDPGMEWWRGTFLLSAAEIALSAGIRAAARYLSFKPLKWRSNQLEEQTS